ncbi:MAG: hypothetical protein EP343_28630 [Deltaproteobacteria bacterium]|nr:MAG: hypothetical protein EP343_28630 [Deltaproteobacteria bacterium]
MRRWFWIACILFLIPQTSYARRGYTQSQANAIARAAYKKKLSDALRKDKWLNDYNKKKRAWQKNGYCKFVVLTAKETKCSRKCKHLIRSRRKKCRRQRKCRTITKRKRVKMCAVRDRSGRIVYRVNGRRKKRRFGSRLKGAFKGFGKDLKKGFKQVGKGFSKAAGEMKKLARKAAKRTKDITRKIKRQFQRALAAFRRKCQRIAKQLANSPKWKGRLASRIGSVMFKKALSARSMAQGKFRSKLLSVLRSSRSLSAVQRTKAIKQAGLRSSKAFGKTAMISVSLAVSFSASTVVADCWAFSGQKKRSCLTRSINTQMRVLSFNVLAALVQVGIDLKIIEPIAHSLAAAVAASAAAATFGIGAAAYPLAYLAASVALNAVLAVVLERVVRSRYDSVYNSRMAGSMSGFSRSLVGGIPSRNLKCGGPKRLCRN